MNNIETLNQWLALETEFSTLPDFQKNVKFYVLYKKLAYLYKLILGNDHDLVISSEARADSYLLNISDEKWRNSLAVNIPTMIQDLPIEIARMPLKRPEDL